MKLWDKIVQWWLFLNSKPTIDHREKMIICLKRSIKQPKVNPMWTLKNHYLLLKIVLNYDSEATMFHWFQFSVFDSSVLVLVNNDNNNEV
jgi:hypothetical protein